MSSLLYDRGSAFSRCGGGAIFVNSRTTTREKRVCRVGYAMNAKKLRKSHAPAVDTVTEPVQSSLGSPVPLASSSSCVAPKRRLNGRVSRPWRGGGLADILVSQPSDTEAEEGMDDDSENSDCEERIVRFYPFVFPTSNTSTGESVAETVAVRETVIGEREGDSVGESEDDEREDERQKEAFQVLIHKLTDDIEKGDPVGRLNALKRYIERERMKGCRRRDRDSDRDSVEQGGRVRVKIVGREVILVDPFEAVSKVTSRTRTCDTLRSIIHQYHTLPPSLSPHTLSHSLNHTLSLSSSPLPPFTIPRYIIVNKEMSDDDILLAMREHSLTFPVICKPVEACGTPHSHSMVSESIPFH